jgi:hypothetical protein
MKHGLSIFYDHRRAAGNTDAVGRRCAQCAVATVANPSGACRLYRADGQPCLVARGRYRRAYRAAIRVVHDKPHLETSIDRFAMLAGQIEQLKVERAAVLGDGKSATDFDDTLTALHRQLSGAMREAGLAAHVTGAKEPEYDEQLYSK